MRNTNIVIRIAVIASILRIDVKRVIYNYNIEIYKKNGM
jgi:hypothetical protein